MTKQEIVQQLRDIVALAENEELTLGRISSLAGAIEFDMDTEAELEGEALVEDTF